MWLHWLSLVCARRRARAVRQGQGQAASTQQRDRERGRGERGYMCLASVRAAFILTHTVYSSLFI